MLYHAPHRRPLQDVLTCIREKCTIAEAGFRLEANAERHLKAPAEMARLLSGLADSESGLAAVRARKPALLLLDIWMQGGGMDGLELLDMVKALDADLPVIMISGHGNIETAVSAIKRGAYEFLEKPFKSDRLLLVVERALETTNLRRENRRLRAQAITPEGLLGKSMPAQQLRQMIAKLAGANSRVLISGPPGAGKETVARLIHGGSHRARNEFVAISAAGMTPERMDLELFGEEGADS